MSPSSSGCPGRLAPAGTRLRRLASHPAGTVLAGLGRRVGHGEVDGQAGVTQKAYGLLGRRAGDPAVLVAYSEKIRTEMGWVPEKAPLEAMVGDAWEWLSAHRDRH